MTPVSVPLNKFGFNYLAPTNSSLVVRALLSVKLDSNRDEHNPIQSDLLQRPGLNQSFQAFLSLRLLP